MPEQIEIDFTPIVGNYITFNKVTSIITKVTYNLDDKINYIIADVK